MLWNNNIYIYINNQLLILSLVVASQDGLNIPITQFTPPLSHRKSRSSLLMVVQPEPTHAIAHQEWRLRKDSKSSMVNMVMAFPVLDAQKEDLQRLFGFPLLSCFHLFSKKVSRISHPKKTVQWRCPSSWWLQTSSKHHCAKYPKSTLND